MPLWVWLLPTAIPLLAFTYLPALRIAVEGFPALSKLFNGENLNSLKITLLYTLLTVPLSVLLGLLAALALEGDNRFRQFVRAPVFHPVVLPTVAFAAVFLYLLNPLGPLQALLQALGLQNPLGDPRGAFLAVVVVGVLKDTGIYKRIWGRVFLWAFGSRESSKRNWSSSGINRIRRGAAVLR
jgi:ABC-type sugar transport system permease subunit